MWVTRGKNRILSLWKNKPKIIVDEMVDYGEEYYEGDFVDYIPDNKSFSDLRFEDGPIEVEVFKKDFDKQDIVYGAKCPECKKEFFYTEKDIDITGTFVKCPECKKEICILD